MPSEPYCELCDLPLAFCVHGHPKPVPEPIPATPVAAPAPRASRPASGRATTRQHARVETVAPREVTVPGFLQVSPEQVAHFPGCPETGNADFDGWGVILRASELAWRELGNGQPVPCDAGNAAELVATSRCTTCADHGRAWI